MNISRRAKHSLLLKLTLFLLIALVPIVCAAQRKITVIEDSWKVDSHCGVPVEAAFFAIVHTKKELGSLYLFTEANNFTEKNLKQLFTCYSKEYPNFVAFGITVFTERENLKILVKNFLKPPPDADPPDDTSETDCADLSKAIRPCPTGYYKAGFYRSSRGTESFTYTTDTTGGRLVTINLFP